MISCQVYMTHCVSTLLNTCVIVFVVCAYLGHHRFVVTNFIPTISHNSIVPFSFVCPRPRCEFFLLTLIVPAVPSSEQSHQGIHKMHITCLCWVLSYNLKKQGILQNQVGSYPEDRQMSICKFTPFLVFIESLYLKMAGISILLFTGIHFIE